jgi:hypothetical protein
MASSDSHAADFARGWKFRVISIWVRSHAPLGGNGSELNSSRSAGCRKTLRAVILSEAKNLHLFVFKATLQMLRCAQQDRQPFSVA